MQCIKPIMPDAKLAPALDQRPDCPSTLNFDVCPRIAARPPAAMRSDYRLILHVRADRKRHAVLR